MTVIETAMYFMSIFLAVITGYIAYKLIKYVSNDKERREMYKKIQQYGNRAAEQLDKRHVLQQWGGQIGCFLSWSGANHMLHKRIKPYKFVLLSLLSGILFASLFGYLYGLIGILAGAVGCLLPAGILYLNNRSDNDNMLMDINSMYDALCIQTAAGMYLGSAIRECSRNVKNKRLKAALMEFNANTFILKRMSIEEALQDFILKFRNPHLDMLVLVLEQSMKSGQAAKYLKDLQEQMADVQHAMQIKKESSTGLKLSLVQVLIYVSIIAIVIFAVGNDMMESLNDMM